MNIFSTPITVYNFGENSRQLNKRLIEDIMSEQYSRPGFERSGVNVWQSDEGMEKRHESFTLLRSLVFPVVHNFIDSIGAKETNDSKFAIENFWANVNTNQNAFHLPHIHGVGRTFLSGVYYPSSGIKNDIDLSDQQDLNENIQIVSTNRPPPGSLVLHDPSQFVKTQVRPDNLQSHPYFGLPIIVVPKEGALVLFPNYIPHSVVPTAEPDLTRISIAFEVTI